MWQTVNNWWVQIKGIPVYIVPFFQLVKITLRFSNIKSRGGKKFLILCSGQPGPAGSGSGQPHPLTSCSKLTCSVYHKYTRFFPVYEPLHHLFPPPEFTLPPSSYGSLHFLLWISSKILPPQRKHLISSGPSFFICRFNSIFISAPGCKELSQPAAHSTNISRPLLPAHNIANMKNHNIPLPKWNCLKPPWHYLQIISCIVLRIAEGDASKPHVHILQYQLQTFW